MMTYVVVILFDVVLGLGLFWVVLGSSWVCFYNCLWCCYMICFVVLFGVLVNSCWCLGLVFCC